MLRQMQAPLSLSHGGRSGFRKIVAISERTAPRGSHCWARVLLRLPCFANSGNITEDVLREFFQPGEFRRKLLPNEQVFDFEGLKGRALSSSYVPGEGHAMHAAFMEELETIFKQHNHAGRIAFAYETQVYYGRVV